MRFKGVYSDWVDALISTQSIGFILPDALHGSVYLRD